MSLPRRARGASWARGGRRRRRDARARRAGLDLRGAAVAPALEVGARGSEGRHAPCGPPRRRPVPAEGRSGRLRSGGPWGGAGVPGVPEVHAPPCPVADAGPVRCRPAAAPGVGAARSRRPVRPPVHRPPDPRRFPPACPSVHSRSPIGPGRGPGARRPFGSRSLCPPTTALTFLRSLPKAQVGNPRVSLRFCTGHLQSFAVAAPRKFTEPSVQRHRLLLITVHCSLSF